MLVEAILKNFTSTIHGKEQPPRMIWCHSQIQDRYQSNTMIKYHEGLVEDPSQYVLIVVDDLMSELGSDNRLLHLFTKGSHHLRIRWIFIVQNVFHQAKNMRGISLNCQYLIIMKNPRDKSQV